MSWQLSHLVNNSWWPIRIRASTFSLICTVLLWLKISINLFVLSVVVITFLIIISIWFRDIIRESTFQGEHRALVQGGLKWGLVWFLFSEVWFFFRVFWTFFHFRLAPLSRRFQDWPGIGLSSISPFQIPLLNTIILLIRGVTATLAHHELLAGYKSPWILWRVVLGVYFLILQGFEYATSFFSISSGAYGRIFFFGTGFHGLHVCIGALMLLVRALRLSLSRINSQHHFGLEFSLWYWHFVDVVWLFLFFWVYAWGR